MSTEESPRLLYHHLAWGIALGVAVSLAIQILTWLGLGLSHLTWISTWALVVVFAAIGGRSLGRRLGGRPGLLQAVAMLILMILASRVIYQSYMYVYINFIDPTWRDTVVEVWSRQLRDAGTAQEQIDEQIANFRWLWETRTIFTTGIVAFVVPQFILGLISIVLAAVQPWKKSAQG